LSFCIRINRPVQDSAIQQNPPAGLKTKFGVRLRVSRKQTGITQEKMATATGLSVESISKIERGIFGSKFGNLEKIAETLKVQVRELFQPNNQTGHPTQ